MKVRWASGFSATEIVDYGEGRAFIARMAGSRGASQGGRRTRESGSATFGNLDFWFWGCQAGEDTQFAYDFASEEQVAVRIFYRFAGVRF